MLRHVMAWMAVILAIAGIAGGLGFYKYNEIQAGIAAGAMTPEPVESVLSARARDGEWSATTRAIGSVVALRQVEIRNEIAGVIAEIGFKSGEVVEPGALLVHPTFARSRPGSPRPRPTRVSPSSRSIAAKVCATAQRSTSRSWIAHGKSMRPPPPALPI